MARYHKLKNGKHIRLNGRIQKGQSQIEDRSFTPEAAFIWSFITVVGLLGYGLLQACIWLFQKLFS